jgi:hypothetical protein
MNIEEWNGGLGAQKLWLNPTVHTITADSSTTQTMNATTVNANMVNSVGGNYTGILAGAIINAGQSLSAPIATLTRAQTTESFGSASKFVLYGGTYIMSAAQFCGGIFSNFETGVVGSLQLPNDVAIDSYLSSFPGAATSCVSFVLNNRDTATSRTVYRSDGAMVVYVAPPAPGGNSPSQVTLYFNRVGGVWTCLNTKTSP